MPIPIGSVTGKISLDISSATASLRNIQGAIKRLRGAFGDLEDVKLGGPAKGMDVLGLRTGMTAGLVTSLTTEFIRLGQQAARALLDIAEKGIELQATLETAGIAFSEMFGDPGLGAATLAFLDQVSAKLRLGRTDAVRFAQAILPRVESTEQFVELLELATVQARATNRAVSDMVFPIKEALSGDFVSLRDRFDIGKEQVARIKELAKDVGLAGALIAVLGEEFERRGIKNVEAFADTFEMKMADLGREWENLTLVFGKPIFEELKEVATEALRVFEEHGDDVERVTKAAGELAAKFVEIVGSGIIGFFDDLDYRAIERLVDDFHLMLLTAQTLVETVGGIKFGESFLEELHTVVEQLNAAMVTATQIGSMMRAGEAYKEAMYQEVLRQTGLTTIEDIRKALPRDFAGLDRVAKYGIKAITIEAAKAGLLDVDMVKAEQAAVEARNQVYLDALKNLEDLGKEEEKLEEKQDDRGKEQDDLTEAEQEALDTELALKDARDNLGKSTESLAGAEEKLGEETEKLAQERLDVLVDQERDWLKAEEDFAQKRVDAAREAARDIEDVERKHAQGLEDAVRDLGRDEADLARKQARAVVDLARASAQERVEIEQRYHEQVADIRNRFELSAGEAIRERDAIAFLRLQRQRAAELEQAKTDRDRDVEDSQQSAERKREELRISLEREREDAQTANQRKLEDLQLALERELEEQRTNYGRELEELRINEDRKREELRQGHEWEVADFATKEERKLAKLRESVDEQLAEYQRLEEEVTAIQARIAAASQSGVTDLGVAGGGMLRFRSSRGIIGGRQLGGYAVHGLYELGEAGREFVLSADTTRMLERLAGGRLSQEAMLAAAGSPTGKGPVTLELREGAVQVHLHDVGSKDTEALMAEFERKGKALAYEAIQDVFGG